MTRTVRTLAAAAAALLLGACASNEVIYLQYERDRSGEPLLTTTTEGGHVTIVPDGGVRNVLLQAQELDPEMWVVSWKTRGDEHHLRVEADDGDFEIFRYPEHYFRAQTWPYTESFPGQRVASFEGRTSLALLLQSDGTFKVLSREDVDRRRIRSRDDRAPTTAPAGAPRVDEGSDPLTEDGAPELPAEEELTPFDEASRPDAVDEEPTLGDEGVYEEDPLDDDLDVDDLDQPPGAGSGADLPDSGY